MHNIIINGNLTSQELVSNYRKERCHYWGTGDRGRDDLSDSSWYSQYLLTERNKMLYFVCSLIHILFQQYFSPLWLPILTYWWWLTLQLRRYGYLVRWQSFRGFAPQDLGPGRGSRPRPRQRRLRQLVGDLSSPLGGIPTARRSKEDMEDCGGKYPYCKTHGSVAGCDWTGGGEFRRAVSAGRDDGNQWKKLEGGDIFPEEKGKEWGRDEAARTRWGTRSYNRRREAVRQKNVEWETERESERKRDRDRDG